MNTVPLDSLRLHPDAERVPLADSGDLAALRASLEENGQQDPIDVTSDGLILDGRTRWMLLRELGAMTVRVRIVDVPPEQQRHYIVHRALDRRHLTAEQKRALNELLREDVVEVAPHPVTGEPVRIGRTVKQRAETLGVGVNTVERWDRTDAPHPNGGGDDGPTHVRHSDGKVQPIKHSGRRSPGTGSARDIRAGRVPANGSRRIEARPPSRPAPIWRRHFTKWCRGALMEERALLLAMDKEIHEALDRLAPAAQVGG